MQKSLNKAEFIALYVRNLFTDLLAIFKAKFTALCNLMLFLSFQKQKGCIYLNQSLITSELKFTKHFHALLTLYTM